MNTTNMLLAAPELWVLTMACVILIVDLFLREERRGIIHMLAMLTVIFAAIITLRGDYLVEGVQSVTAFKDSFIHSEMVSQDGLEQSAYRVVGYPLTSK